MNYRLFTQRMSFIAIITSLLMLGWNNTATPALAAGTITGTVFQDYNGNGIKDTGSYVYSTVNAPAVDAGVGGIVVTAYDASGQVGTTTTAANGTYTLSHTGSGTIRVEFTALPAGFQPGPNATTLTPDGSPGGVVKSGTTVQFIAATGTANLGIMRPEEYCQNNPQLATSCYISGDPLGGGTTGASNTLLSIPFNASGTTPAPTYLATNAQVGAVWGEAWQRSSKTLFTSAFVKRHVGLGPLGIGGIYMTNMAVATPTTTSYINVASLGINVGSINSSTRALPADAATPSNDAEAYAKVGKQGIGGIALSDDETTLWMINLNTRSLYSIAIGNPRKAAAALSSSDVKSYATDAPWLTTSPCTNGVARPFGVTYHRGKVYVGVVCTAENSGAAADLHAYVYALDPVAYAANTATGYSLVINFALNFTRGVATDRVSGSNVWFPWIDTYALSSFRSGTVSDCCGGYQIARPMPILADIAFDSNNAMILGFGDRDSHMFGNANYPPTGTDLLLGTTGGDIMRACPNTSGTYILENNGACGGVSGSGVGDNQGPGGGEFYGDDQFNSPNHQETSDGGLSYFPGSSLTLMTGSDPNAYNTGGLYWMNNTTGNSVRRYETYSSATPGNFGKAAGIGDVTLLCDSAPIELGNRVWNDANNNGIQDADEASIDGVAVTLWADTNSDTTVDTQIGSTTTANGGQYYFGGASNQNLSAGQSIKPNTAYEVRIATTQSALVGLAPTKPTNDATANGTSRDSNGVISGTNSVAALTTGSAGSNDHTIDFGFYAPVSVGNQVWFDTNNNSALDSGESGADGVTVNLFYDADSSGTLTGSEQTPIASQLTSSGGFYLFTRTTSGAALKAGTYFVGLPAANFSGAGVLAGYRSSATSSSNAGVISDATVAANTDTNVDDADDGVSQTSGFLNGGVLSGKLTVTVGGEPGGSTPGHTNTVDGTAGGSAIPNVNTNRTVDFGFYRQTLGDIVFNDANNNGTYDSGESPLAGATVKLFAANGTTELLVGADGILGTADDAAGGVTTNAGGSYLFSGLPQGDYRVQVTPPVGYTSSTDLSSSANPNNNINSDDNGVGAAAGAAMSAAVTLTPGSAGATSANTVTPASGTTANPTVDFGFYTLSIGNLIWNDTDNNGKLNGSETGINGVTVNLYRDADASGTLNAGDTLVKSQNTSNGGHYLFTDLLAGTYFVQVAPSNFAAGSALVGYHSSTGTNGALTGPYEPVASVGSTDSDDNGTTGSGGLATTGITGGITSGPIALAAGTQPTGETDITPPTGITDSASDANSNLTIDFGVFQPASLGDFVWKDVDKDGVQDAGEPGVNGVQVSLYTPNGKDGISGTADDTLPVATTTTATNGGMLGYYHFANLNPNTSYTIALNRASDFATGGPLAGYTLTGQDQGGDDTKDSDAALIAGVPTISATTGGPGSDTPTYDFGFSTSASLGDYIWLDSNNDGIQDASESGINGVTVSLYNAAGTTLIDTQVTTTSAGIDGYYHFANLVPNTSYVIKLDNPANFSGSGPLANTQLSPKDAGGDDAKDSDAALVSGTPTIAIATTGGPGTDTPTYDIGFYRPAASLGDFVWNDLNHNGVQDGTESGINGATVHLYDATGTTLISTTLTAGNGAYHFASLVPNTTYVVKLDNPADFTGSGPLASFILTTKDLGGDDTKDSDAVVASGYPTISSATTGADKSDTTTYDFGFFQPFSIGNQVWFDTDNSSTINGSEAGVDGVIVELFLDANNDGALTGSEQTPIATQTTSSGGFYLFTQTTNSSGVGTGTALAPGHYLVGLPAANFSGAGVLAGYRSSATSSSNTGVISDATVAASTDTNVDDADDGVSQTSGFYAGGVLSGPLSLTEGGEPGGTTPGHANTVDGTASGSAIPNSNTNRTVDFGFYRQTLGNLVFHDTNNNGVYDAGTDMPLSGATVKLFAADGSTLLQSFTTTSTGVYQFSALAQGDYRVQVTPPAGYTSSTDIASSADPNNNADNDDNGVGTATGPSISAAVTLTPNSSGASFPNNVVTAANGTTSNPTLDFGFYTLSIGNQVWDDSDNNGQLNGSEAGINGVTVQLYRDADTSGTLSAGDTLVDSKTTSNNGHYLFSGLAPATYFVQVAPSNFAAGGVLLGYQSSTGTNGALTGPYEPGVNNATDRDDNGTTGSGGLATGGITSGPIALAAGTQPTSETDLGMPTSVTDSAANANSNLTIDFGVFQPASLGDFVWNDLSKDGVQDAGEPGLNGVQVSLYTPDGADGIPGNADDSAPVLQTTTATIGGVAGSYHFANLTPNTSYTIALDRSSDQLAGGPLNGYTLTSQNAGSDDAKDSDAALIAGVPTISATTGAPGSDTPTYDFGFTTSASLGDYIWLDSNNDGVQNASESGINGVTVSLYDSAGTTLISSQVTSTQGGVDGYYHFANLVPNTSYVIKLDNPANFTGSGPLANTQLSPLHAGSDTAKDSDAALVGGTPTISATTGGPGTDTPTYDVGFYRPAASLGDYIWNDANNNGIQEAGESGINGVTVHLYDATGTTLVMTTTTVTNAGTQGFYHFDNLVPNTTYVVKLDNPADYAPGGPLENFILVPAAQGGDPARDSDATSVGDYPTIVNASTGVDKSDTTTYDIGLYQPLSIGNLVWNDVNNNGVKDGSESGIDNVTVNLYRDSDNSGSFSTSDTLIGSQLTSNSGHYLFSPLGKGTYFVQIAGSNFTTGQALAGYASSTGQPGGANGPYEPGATTPADNDDNGSNSARTIISGPIVLAAGSLPTAEPDMGLPTGASKPATDANNDMTIDFGVFLPARIGNIVWNDLNADGIKQANEPGVANVTVTLYDAAGTPVATTTSDSTGAYQFINLPPGTYTVGFTNLPSGATFTSAHQGSGTDDSDVDPSTGRTAPIVVQPGDNYSNVYAGIVQRNATAITLTQFTAAWRGAALTVQWTTSAEINTFGFHLLRSNDGDRAHATRVTPTLIVAQGRASGASYSWVDPTASASQGYTYWLEEIEVNGTTTIYGPTSVSARPAATAHTIFVPITTR